MRKVSVLLVALLVASMLLTGCGDPCANGHTEGDWIVDTQATCTTNGSRHLVCSVCGQTIKTEEIVSIEHDLVTEKGTATLTQAGTTDKIYCKVCGEVIQESQEVEAGMYKEERYNPDEPTYIVKKVSEGFLWDNIEIGNINVENWKDRKGYNPEAEFQVVHTDDSIIVRFVCHNDYVTSKETETNAIVCGDACVEFFISPSSDAAHYYNFEMNSLGTLYLAYGVDAWHGVEATDEGRKVIDPAIIHQYTNMEVHPKTKEYVDTKDGPRGEWGVTLTINKELFKVVSGIDFADGFAKAGFYKCGDLPVVEKARGSAEGHLLAWNTINTKDKNNQGFHTVKDFGNLAFED